MLMKGPKRERERERERVSGFETEKRRRITVKVAINLVQITASVATKNGKSAPDHYGIKYKNPADKRCLTATS
jgi:hypothetical protein